MNVEGPSRDCAPQTHTPCEGTSAQSEDAAHRSAAPQLWPAKRWPCPWHRGAPESRSPRSFSFLFPLTLFSLLISVAAFLSYNFYTTKFTRLECVVH